MDRVKLLKQAHNRHYRGLGILATHVHVIRLEGVLGLYKGNGTQMIRIFPYAAVQFLSYEYYYKVFHATSMNRHLAQLFSGSFAGFTAVAVTYPLDMIRARLAFQVTGEHVYSGIIHALQSIINSEGGVRGLYRGIIPTILGMAPYAGLSFYGFEKLKAGVLLLWPKLLGKVDENNPSCVTLTIPAKLLCGGLAGAFAQTISVYMAGTPWMSSGVAFNFQFSYPTHTFITEDSSPHCCMCTRTTESAMDFIVD